MNARRVCFGIGCVAILLSIFPFFLAVILPVTPGRVNPLWDNWPYDFNYYRSIITEGKNGRVTVIDKYTTEKQSGKFLRIGYVAIGHVARVLHIDETTAYHVARILLGVIFVYCMYLLINQSFSEKPYLIAFIFFCALFVGGIPEYICSSSCRWIPRLWGMTQFDPIRRLTFLPHYQWGNVSFLLVCISLISKNTRHVLYVAFSSLILGIASLDHPPSLILLYPILFLTVVVLLWKRSFNKQFLQDVCIIVSFTLPFIVYEYVATNDIPWNQMRYTKVWLNSDIWNLLLTFGPLSIIGCIVGMYVLIMRNRVSTIFILCASWIFFVFFMTFVGYKTGLFSQTRFLHTAIQIPSAILTGFALSILYTSFLSHSTKAKKIIVGIGAFIVIVVPTIPTLYLMYYDQIDYVVYFSKNTLSTIPYPNVIDYPPKLWMDGFAWLSKNTDPDTIVLSDFTAGNYIPTYGGNTVYYGHSVETYEYERKKGEVIRFFTSEDSIMQRKFLDDNKINYIFFGPQEKAYRQSTLTIPNVIPVFDNDLVTIYEVK